MSTPLNRLLEHVLEGEPPLGDEVDAVFRRADRLRRRRGHLVLAAGVATAGLIVSLGYVLTTTLLPSPPAGPVATAAPGAEVVAVTPPPTPSMRPLPTPSRADSVLAVIEPLVEGRGLTVVPGSAERGDGWRRYGIAGSDGRARGSIEVGIFDVRKKWCFPVAADPDACARADSTEGVESVRYDDVSDPDRQVRQTIARRLDDNRVVAVMASGTARRKPALTGAQVEQVATDERIFDAFRKPENCNDGCPEFGTPVSDRLTRSPETD
ncbi:hypothetical protein [Actinoplanes solisilvae]|uniref:hypothetical protein n=1 Tax=Actinoplanes solisilvae TaxID=2486853 RepID=UPI000FD8289C|nr:hypothetical protein [Actinoplanes solisilvae]